MVECARDRFGAALRVLVAQSSQMLTHCEPLQTAKQFLRRWRQPGLTAAGVASRLMADAGPSFPTRVPLSTLLYGEKGY